MHVLKVRAPHLSFMFLKEYWFRELYLGLKVTASFDRSESYTRVCDLWDPGWGIPGFRSELCCFFHPLAWPFVFFRVVRVLFSFSVAILMMTHNVIEKQ